MRRVTFVRIRPTHGRYHWPAVANTVVSTRLTESMGNFSTNCHSLST